MTLLYKVVCVNIDKAFGGRHTMRVIRATHLGMCFGVRDAIALALASAEAGPLTILGDLVHNPTVLGRLAARGIAVANDVAQVTTHTLMVTAHGASARALASTRALVRGRTSGCAPQRDR